MSILAVSDVESESVYSHNIRTRFPQVSMAISCGDLPAYYLEYILTTLDVKMYYVHGNHVQQQEEEGTYLRREAWGAINLHRSNVYDQENDLLMAGIEGSLRYNRGSYQYTQQQMWQMTLELVPKLLANKARYGRYLDIFITHAPSAGIQDDSDPAHRGVDAFRWLVDTFQPKLHLHGHIHLYTPLNRRESQRGKTRVLNCYGYREIQLPL